MENRKIREVDINEYLPVLIDIINTGNDVSLLISGSSMSPFLIHHRDTIIISKPDRSFKKGDMVFFKRINGQYVMHRIHHLDKSGNLFLVGDGQKVIEGPIKPEQVFGIIYKVIRKGKVVTKGDFWWFFFEKIWIRMVPFRRFFINVYAKYQKNKKL